MPAQAGQPIPMHMLRLHQAGAVVGTISQGLLCWSMWAAGEGSGLRAHTLLLAVAMLALTVGMLRSPSWYYARRLWLLPLARLALYSAPSFRSIGVGSALMLERPAGPGAWGAATDWLRLISGTRLLGLVVGDLAMPLQSPAVRLATQSALLFLTSNTGGYCGTQLLRHPLSLERMRWLAEGLNHLSLPLLSMMPCSPRSMWLPQPGTPPEQLCAATLAMQRVTIGVLLPVLLAAHAWRPEGQRASSAPHAAGYDGKLRAAGSRLHAAANGMLAAIAGAGRGMEAAVVTWMLLVGALWWECRAAAGL